MSVVKKRRLEPHVIRKKSDRWGDDRKEQINLGMGTGEYRELVRDHDGVDEGSYVPEGPAIDAGEDRRPDEDQVPKTEDDHVAELAGDLKKAAEAVQEDGVSVAERTYRQRMAKLSQVPELHDVAVAAAAETPDEEDDKKAACIRDGSDIPDPSPVYDPTVSRDEFIPKSMRRIFGD